jgi:beta-N-acetylhexosaminidase
MTSYSAGRKAFICGLSGLVFTPEETAFFQAERPWGLILFKRNCETPEQIKALVSSFRAIAGDEAPVFIDQEGGRVQRLRAPYWHNYPSAEKLIQADLSERAVYLTSRLIAADLVELGISSNCGPVVDIAFAQTHDVIGDRAYGKTPEEVARFATASMHGLQDGGLLPVIKHIPGHGRATADSHLELPTVTAPEHELEATDFAAFKALSDAPMAMTAHILYQDIDPDHPATLSKTIINGVIRGTICFYNLLMSDDISMKALNGDIGELSTQAIAAGCDLVLHCNGEMEEMQKVAANVPELSAGSLQRAEKALHKPKLSQVFDKQAALEELHSLVPQFTLIA